MGSIRIIYDWCKAVLNGPSAWSRSAVLGSIISSISFVDVTHDFVFRF